MRDIRNFGSGQIRLKDDKGRFIQNPRVTGIYCIRNKTNGKVYVGAAKDVHSRHNKHFLMLLDGEHTNKNLAEDFEKKQERENNPNS